MVFENLLNPILGPLLKLNSLVAVLILSLLVSLIITVIYKYTTNQSLMKDLKSQLKEMQKQMKELRSHPEEMMKVQKKSMEINMKYMGHSMKATLFTFLPIIILFGWMNAHLSYDPILPGQDFTTKVYFEEGISGDVSISVPDGVIVEGSVVKEIVNNEAMWALNGDEGEYLLEYDYNNKKYYKDVLITSENEYLKPVKAIKDGNVNRIEIEHTKNIVLNLFGWKLGWLGTYIILSIIFSMVLRKVMKVY